MIAWDETKRQKNLKLHGIDLAELECLFDFAMLTKFDERIAYGEQRMLSLAWFHGRVVFLVWTERNDCARLISCRYGTKYENIAYFQAISRN